MTAIEPADLGPVVPEIVESAVTALEGQHRADAEVVIAAFHARRAALEQYADLAAEGDPLAVDEIGIADEAIDKAFERLTAGIATMVTDGEWHRGMRALTPTSWPTVLIVAEVLNEGAGELSTVVFSQDGARVRADRHNPDATDDGTPIADDIEPIVYEHWWGRGLRFSGTAHPRSRGMIDVKVAG